MPMFNRNTVQDQVMTARSRFQYMANSSDPVDRANAELYRIAANTYQDLANDMIDPETLPEDLSVYVDRLRKGWDRYCKTGIVGDEIGELENVHVATLVTADGKPHKPAAPKRPRVDQSLREWINPRAVETVVAEISSVLNLPYQAPEYASSIPDGLIRVPLPAASEDAPSESVPQSPKVAASN